MQVAVGYSENPDTSAAGVQAAREALEKAGRADPCDLVLLFATARHDAHVLRGAVMSVFGAGARIVGGGAVGTMTNERFGNAGDQIGLAAFWLDGIECGLTVERGLERNEEETGRRLGTKLVQAGVTRETPFMLFYDAVDWSGGDLRLIMATYLLNGLRETLGFLPDGMVGAGLQGDYRCTPTQQWTGHGLARHSVLGLSFTGDLRIDNVIMHGCRPATGYYTVTKAEKQTIFEINGEPAIPFLQKLLGPAITPEEYAFFLILGINSGDKWGDFNEENYASRLCLAIDPERNGIVMFEPDMVEGTRFQIMHRSMDLGYMAPRMENLFNELKGRRPVFAFYIDCAGRAAGYAGMDLEDAVMVQKVIAGRVPFLGIYSGVEIAPVSGGAPRALDWTGVFCLFSVPE